jgi:hypothetical protein
MCGAIQVTGCDAEIKNDASGCAISSTFTAAEGNRILSGPHGKRVVETSAGEVPQAESYTALTQHYPSSLLPTITTFSDTWKGYETLNHTTFSIN